MSLVSQTTEGAQVELAPEKFTWIIGNFSKLTARKLYSETFIVGDYKWRVVMFPQGNRANHLSIYLEVADSDTLPHGWSQYVRFSMRVENAYHIGKEEKRTQCVFNARRIDWGFQSFIPLSVFYDPIHGYIFDDTVIVETEFLDVLESKEACVGLMNLGKTSYINALLQNFFHIPFFRKAIYQVPISVNESRTENIPLALQSVFYKLQYSGTLVKPKELVNALGWDEHCGPHDIHEFSLLLCERLEQQETFLEGKMQQLFQGHLMNYIECIKVEHKSTRKESFYDLQLDVKGCRDVYASFDKYVEVGCLEGDNKYRTEHHDLQDAKKHVLFIDFPPVLQLQLKRFEYDLTENTLVKINDRYEFPLQLDLDKENGKYLSSEADKSVRNLYVLYSVLVHSGDVHDGHYSAFVSPTLSDQWYKFDDELVTKEDMERALVGRNGRELAKEDFCQANLVFNYDAFRSMNSNAYVLVYMRESDKDKILCNADKKHIAEYWSRRWESEQEFKEVKRRYKARACPYAAITVARDDDLKEQIGKDIYFDLVDRYKLAHYRFSKFEPFLRFKEEVEFDFDIPVRCQRFWIFTERKNHTCRPNKRLSALEETQLVGRIAEVSEKTCIAELNLFLEVVQDLNSSLPTPPDTSEEDIMLFFKLYDPEKRELRYVGRLFVRRASKPIEYIGELNRMAGFASDQEIELYEEIEFEPNLMCQHLDKRKSFLMSQMKDGDIICFQKSTPLESNNCQYPDVPSFLEYVHTRQIQVVHFRTLERPTTDVFSLQLSKTCSYNEVVERVAHNIGLDDPSKIRLTSHNSYCKKPALQPIKYQGVEHLPEMLVHYNEASDILYFEILDRPLPELEGLKELKVAFRGTEERETIHNIRLPNQSTVGDLLTELKGKVELSHPNSELRLLRVGFKIYKSFPATEKLENINDWWPLRAEEIPDEEKSPWPDFRVISVCSFSKEIAHNGLEGHKLLQPFSMVINEGETLAEIRVRVQRTLEVPVEEVCKWNFACVSAGPPEYLQDADVVLNHFQDVGATEDWGKAYLGWEHSDKVG